VDTVASTGEGSSGGGSSGDVVGTTGVEGSSSGSTTEHSDSSTTAPTGSSTTSSVDPSTTTAGTTDGTTDADTETTSSTGGDTTGEPVFELCGDSDDLVACYDFADFGDGQITDHSGYGNHGSLSGTMAEDGPFGGAARPNPTPGVGMEVMDSASLDVTGPATWETWVLFDSLPTPPQRAGVVDNDGQYSMIFMNNQMRCDGGNVSARSGDIPTGEWVHIACVHDGSSMSIWVDGELHASSMDNGGMFNTGPTAVMSIADTSPSFNEPMDGRIAGLRIWSRERTEAEIVEAADALDD
jgi:hypothetical protein